MSILLYSKKINECNQCKAKAQQNAQTDCSGNEQGQGGRPKVDLITIPEYQLCAINTIFYSMYSDAIFIERVEFWNSISS